MPILFGYYITKATIFNLNSHLSIPAKNHVKCFLYLFVILSAFSIQLNSQNITTRTNQQWFQYNNELKLNEKHSLLTDGGYRVSESFSKKTLYMVRVGFTQQVTTKIRLSIGVAFFSLYKNEVVYMHEYRPYQDIVFKSKFSKFDFQQRIRVEERIFKATHESNALYYDPFNVRFRYQFMFNIPIVKLSSTNPSRKIALNIGDEVFVNAGKEPVIDQNRVLAGVTFYLNESLGIKFIYNYQLRTLKSNSYFGEDQIFWLQLQHTINLIKSKE